MIQTFGTKDSQIEILDESYQRLVFVSSTNYNGYSLNAMAMYDFEAGQTYIIRVKLRYSNWDSGEFKVCITPAMYLVKGGYSQISSYESIWTVTNTTNYRLATSIKTKQTKVLTFTPSSSGTYVFESEGNYDTFIYVLNPQSFKTFSPIDGSENEVDEFNDDDGSSLNAKVSIELKEGIPYLVIYSSYNISSTSEGSIELHIYKQ